MLRDPTTRMMTIAYTRYANDRYNVHSTLTRRERDLRESRRAWISVILEDKADSVFSKEAVEESSRCCSPEGQLAWRLQHREGMGVDLAHPPRPERHHNADGELASLVK